VHEPWLDDDVTARPADPGADLRTIRALMERARSYRHLPPAAAFTAGALAVAGAGATDAILARAPIAQSLGRLGLVWGAVLVAAAAGWVLLAWRSVRREGAPFVTPLAIEILHALWPPLVGALALTAALSRAGAAELVPAVWMLGYGAGAVAAGGFARRAVRWLGVAFVLAGLAHLALAPAPAVALGATFGGFHLVFGLVLAVRPAREA